MSHPAFLYASFAAAPFGGNVGGVVFLGGGADERWMQGVAADLGAPTTGFVDLPSAEQGDARVRFFTPRIEIGACGHVTVAVATSLVEEGLWQIESGREWKVSTPGGTVPVALQSDRESRVSVSMRQRLANFDACESADVTSILGEARLEPSLPIVVAGTGLRHLLVPVASPTDLAKLVVERDPITQLSARHAVDTIGVYARSTDRGERGIQMRDLCAGIGEVEEPASGTTSAALALALHELGALVQPATIVVAMGIEMGRPSRLRVDLVNDAGAVAANVSGSARRLLSGRLEP